MRLRLLPAIAGLVLAAAPLQAQDTPEASGDDETPDIVVTGNADYGWTEVTRQARAISRETDVRHTPLARFEDRICPGVIGLATEAAEMMVYRLRQVAEKLDIPQAEAGACNPNIVVAFTEDGRADLAALQRKHKLLSEVLSVSEQRELLEEPGPVRVFSIVETRMLNGMPVPRRRNLAQIPVGWMHAGHSKIYTATRQDIVAVTVLLDRKSVQGMTLWQLADYAAMRVYARTREPERHDVDSILSLFSADDAPPAGMTAFDLAYLESLYSGIPNIPGITKIAGVDSKLRKSEPAQE